ncbi:hypothetical protein T484DRAFT_1743552 [Baffinella frigidus]|nr:hypothetical protein T484DRAFT_1743552 [Cryptophyta sp. CCMP2293]
MSNATLILANDQMQQHPPRSERCEDEPGVAISVRPENTSEEPLVGSDVAAALAGGPSQLALPSHGHPGEPEGAADPPSVVLHVPPSVVLHEYKGTDVADVASALLRRIMGTSIDAHLRWGKEGDDCVICLGFSRDDRRD